MIVVQTPLRISLFGGGTDFPEYFSENETLVIGSAINKYIYHCIFDFPSNMFDYNIRLSYQDIEKVNKLNDIKHNVFKLMLEKYSISENIEISMMADLPAFTGLGSSSSFTVGLMNGLNLFKNKEILKPLQLAEKSIHFERKILNDTVGYQDQILASFGDFNFVNLNKQGMQINKQKFSETFKNQLNKNFYLFFTGSKRKAADIEKDKLKNLNKNLTFLDCIKSLSFEAKEILYNEKDIDSLGLILNETWLQKKALSKMVTNSYIDDFYNQGIACGATGGKLLGAGAGGFILFYVPKKNQDIFQKKMSKQYKIDFTFFASGSKVIFSSHYKEQS